MMPGSLKRGASTDREVSPPPAKRTATVKSTFFTPTSQKEPEKVQFQTVHDTLLVARYDVIPQSKIHPVKVAAFDFDDTLVTTKSGNTFSRGSDDWKWWHATVPRRLKQLHSEGYVLVIMSNQGAVKLHSNPKTLKSDMQSLQKFKGKVTAVLNTLDLPITMYAATGKDTFRKPRSGMWEQLMKDLKSVQPSDVDLEQCVFVGDAAGREGDKSARRKSDHSCSDRDLATNVGIPFHTPEEFFLDEAPQTFVRAFDPRTLLDAAINPQCDSVLSVKDGAEVVLFCGSPGSGKSTYYWRHLQPLGYERVNQDILKTRDKCLNWARQHLEDGRSVVVDNTNADTETRASWIKLARAHGVPIRLVQFTASSRLCEHNNTVRALNGDLVR